MKERLYKIVFESDTRQGKAFDIVLIAVILLSIIAVIIDSVPDISSAWHEKLRMLEWLITILFSLEYLLRVWISRRSFNYIFSFYGIIDLLATVPTYLGLMFAGGSSLMVIRALRLLRIFRVLKLSRYTSAGIVIRRSLFASREKIGVFLVAVVTVVIIIGTLMYLIEGEASGFTSIPRGIYWTVVTITTVGYGDIAPVTGAGQFIASLTMLTGYAIIAVPTGIVTAEFAHQQQVRRDESASSIACSKCKGKEWAENDMFCSECGRELDNR